MQVEFKEVTDIGIKTEQKATSAGTLVSNKVSFAFLVNNEQADEIHAAIKLHTIWKVTLINEAHQPGLVL